MKVVNCARWFLPARAPLFFCLCCRRINRGSQCHPSESTGEEEEGGGNGCLLEKLLQLVGWAGRVHLMLESEVALGVLLLNVTILHCASAQAPQRSRCSAWMHNGAHHLLHCQHGGSGTKDTARKIELLDFKQLEHKLMRWREC